MSAFRKAVKGVRRFGATVLEPDPEPGDNTAPPAPPEPPEPTITEERRRVTRIARHQYAEQLIPWKVLAFAVAAGLWVTNDDWSPFGALMWATFLAFAFYVFTDFRLSWRHTGRGRVEFRRPSGGQQRRNRARSVRAAWCGAWIGIWLSLVTLTTPGTPAGALVWLAGAAAWATVSYHGWWAPAANTITAEFDLVLSHPDRAFEKETVTVTPTAAPRPRRQPTPAATTSAASGDAPAVDVQPRVSLPDVNLLDRKADPGKIPPGEDMTDVINKLFAEQLPNPIRAAVVEAIRSPRVTRYGIRPEPGERVQKILSLHKDIARVCKTSTARMLAPIEGSDLIGVEIPNRTADPVTLGEILASPEAQRDSHPLLVGLGKDTNGEYVTVNLAKGPHWLFAGESGGGKSGGLNSVLVSLLTRALPDEVQLILIDPKQVELSRYSGIPHLVMQPVTRPEVAVDALDWAIREAERRYAEMAAHGVQNIDDYNTGVLNGTIKTPRGSRYTVKPFPYLVVLVDELSDLMQVAGEKIEEYLVRIGQIARAAGVHLVLATQRPAVEVVTNKIKANVPARIAYKTASAADSRTIIDKVDAAQLTGKGDLLLRTSDNPVLRRVQGGWVSGKEVDAVVNYWRSEAAAAGLTVPEIQLATTGAEQEEATGPTRLTARDVVLAGAQRRANPEGLVTKEQIVEACPTVGDKSLDAQLTWLTAKGHFNREKLGLYRVINRSGTVDEPQPPLTTQEEGDQ